jgi:NADPH-dependent 2,4-dienoyl-CoA reductase/sulfur reductase-like enzyme/peroxiredoxin family protein/TusA-related sulfurtransferase/rhodanese-related sulfurtransferase
MAKILIVGGVAGGATVATRLRRLNETDEIIMFERDEHISFANCGLPYYLGGVIQSRDRLIVETIAGLKEKFNIDVRNFSEVISIDRVNKRIKIKRIKTGEIYEESFDKLVLSPGAQPIRIPTPGLDEAKNIFTLRNIPDTDKIKRFIDENKPKTAVIVGGGFIGVEMAENFTEQNIHTTIVDLANQILAPLDFEMAKLAQNEMVNHGVHFELETVVNEYKDEGKKVVLKNGKTLQADLIILAIGVKPESNLASSCGLKVGPRGHIITAKTLQTVDATTNEVVEDVYAIGDAIEVYDFVDNSKTAIALAWPANRQGRLVADHINGFKVSYKGSLGSSVVKIFDYIAASTGNSEKSLIRKNTPYEISYVTRGNHAGYYPDAQEMIIKLIFDPKTGKIFGAQAFGHVGTEKRIDVIATAIKGGLTVEDLPDLELCYAPPFSSAKDPVNIAGYAASNVMAGVYKTIRYNQIDEVIKKGGFVVDARTRLEYDLHHIEGAINIPQIEMRNRINEFPSNKDTPVYLYCNIGHTGYLAVQILRGYGYTNIYNLTGGIKMYNAVYQFNPNEKVPEFHNPEERKIEPMNQTQIKRLKVDACGLQCPGPIMETFKTMQTMKEGDIVEVEATDSGFTRDVEKWAKSTGNTLVSVVKDGNIYRATLQKGGPKSSGTPVQLTNDSTTIVLFSGDLDKALASLIIAQGARAMGKNVTIFATFWGLNLLRKPKGGKVKKPFVEKMFGWMMPKGAKKMKISKMNFGGAGTAMIKGVMKKKNVRALEVQLQDAMKSGVNFIACTMSMDIMGIRKEELINGIDYAGVATYLAESENAGVTLFI